MVFSKINGLPVGVGGEGGMEAGLVERAKLPFKAIPAAGVHGVGLRQLPGNLVRLGRGVRQARRIYVRALIRLTDARGKVDLTKVKTLLLYVQQEAGGRATFDNLRWQDRPVAPLLSEVIRRANEGRSVGELFNE